MNQQRILPMHVFVGCASWLGFMFLAFAPLLGIRFNVSIVGAIIVCVVGFVFGWVGQLSVPVPIKRVVRRVDGGE